MCETLIEAVERHFGSIEPVPPGREVEFLRDNGGTCIAADTRALTRSSALKSTNTLELLPSRAGDLKSEAQH